MEGERARRLARTHEVWSPRTERHPQLGAAH